MIRLTLAERATARGHTLSSLQRATGLTFGLLRRYWYNDTSAVTLSALVLLCRELDTSPGDLLELVDINVPTSREPVLAHI